MPETTKFKKKVLRSGTFKASTLGGGRSVEAFPKNRLKDIADNTNKMIEEGLKIPAPFNHADKDGTVPKPFSSSESTSWDPSVNAGYWTGFEIDSDGDLVGEVEVPGTEDDQSSLAYKVGKTIQEVSPLVKARWTDGVGREWKDSLWHVAFVNHPVQPDQDNFKPVEDKEAASAMSIFMSDQVDPSPSDGTSVGFVNEIVSLLGNFGIKLPGNTSETNILERLVVALTAISDHDGNEDPLTTAPKNSQLQTNGVMMSQDPKNENTTEKDEALEKKAAAVLSLVSSNTKAGIKTRIDALVKDGKVGKTYADEHLYPGVEALALSLDDISEDGKIAKTPLEITLDALEQNNASLFSVDSDDEGNKVEDPPAGSGTSELTDKELDEVYKYAGLQ